VWPDGKLVVGGSTGSRCGTGGRGRATSVAESRNTTSSPTSAAAIRTAGHTRRSTTDATIATTRPAMIVVLVVATSDIRTEAASRSGVRSPAIHRSTATSAPVTTAPTPVWAISRPIATSSANSPTAASTGGWARRTASTSSARHPSSASSAGSGRGSAAGAGRGSTTGLSSKERDTA
jgi:hypothetical protein